MNKHELEEMNRLRERAEEKIPKYEKEIDKQQCKIKELEKGQQRNNPDIIITMRDAMVALFEKFPKAKFRISGDFGHRNSYTLETTDVCPI